MKTLALALLVPLIARADVTLTFPAALERAVRMHAPASDTSILDTLPTRTLPVFRAETAFSSAENLNLLSEDVRRFDAFTAIVSADYPLLDRHADQRRAAMLRADAQLLRHPTDAVFQQTLDAFAQLYLAQERIKLLRVDVAKDLQKRAAAKVSRGDISLLTATQWKDQALATQSQYVDLELQRIEAETRLKQLIGDTSTEPIHAVLGDVPLPAVAPSVPQLREQRQRLALEEALAARRTQLLLSAFGGVATVPSTYRSNAEDGTYGIYGVRLSLTLPMFDAGSARRVAEARLQLDEATRARAIAEDEQRNHAAMLKLGLAAADKRIELLSEGVRIAQQRQQSVARLVAAGVRSDADLADATNGIAKRESDLLAVRVEKWKLQQQIKYAGQ